MAPVPEFPIPPVPNPDLKHVKASGGQGEMDFQAHRDKVLHNLKGQTGLVYLAGNPGTTRKFSDTDEVFRQESNFYYMTAINEPDMHFVLDCESGASTLFCPPALHDPDHVLWCGRGPELVAYKETHGFTSVVYSTQLKETLEKASKVHVIEEFPSISAAFDLLHLKTALTEARVFKTALEVSLLQKAADITTDAHIALMKAAKDKGASERSLHALLEYKCFLGGAPLQAYTPIVAFNRNAAILHYIKNDAPFPESEPERAGMVLIDAGCEYNLYTSDVTRTFPLNGVYTGDNKTLYEIVLDAQLQVIDAIRPGVEYEALHTLALKRVCAGLVKAGVLVGEVDELVDKDVAAMFFPHGLGHYLGLDVHDVGGYKPGVERSDRPGYRNLRMKRTLEKDQVITVEPGCYFIDSILDEAIVDEKIAKYFNVPVLSRFRKLGGVRIEDDILVTENGCDVLTKNIPKTIAEIEAVMR